MIQYFFYSVSIVFGSWLVGILMNGLLKNTAFYKKLSNLHFINSKKLNKALGLGAFKWTVKNTFFKYFNQNLKVKGQIEISDIEALKREMTSAEIGHLTAFVLVSVFALVKSVNVHYSFGIIMMLLNILLNLYPSLLQQENKRRIDRLLVIARKHR